MTIITLSNRNGSSWLYPCPTALVHQQELLFGFLTVREHLEYHATTRMSHKYNPEQIQERIKQVCGGGSCSNSKR